MSFHASREHQDRMLYYMVKNDDQSYTPAATVYLGLLTALSDDGDTYTEVTSGDGYARQAITFDVPDADGTSENTNDIEFPAAEADKGTVTHYAIFDASTAGNLLFYAPISGGIEYDIDIAITVAIGDALITLGNHIVPSMSTKLINYYLRNQSWTAITTVKIALLTAYTDEGTFTEVTGGSYARVTLSLTATPTASVFSNDVELAFPTATASWGNVSHVLLVVGDTSTVIMARERATVKSVPSGRTVKYAAGRLTITIG